MREALDGHRRIGSCFGLSHPPFLAVRPIGDAAFSATHLHRPTSRSARKTVRLPPQNAYFLMLYLRDADHCDLAADGASGPVNHYREGTICLVDLAEGASIQLHSELSAIAFLLPYGLIDEISTFSQFSGAKRLRCRRGEQDDTVSSIGLAILPLFEQEKARRRPVLQHIAIALCAHVLHHYGEQATGTRSTSALTVWQEKAAKDFMANHFAERIDTAAIAHALGLPTEVVEKEFLAATGKTCEAWLTQFRLTQARRHFFQYGLEPEEIASRCGFRDAAHLKEEFIRSVGSNPAESSNLWMH
ncbi:hypothetical protein BJF91_12875 [Allorhizobium taibaishanense]|uniref:HTH araC/xylS-type domain-containing protein n=2 Tax=Allorhizobium taibaishanense TaxID=887144 RepID=A0A1Q9A6M4_9HYPH|nr:hypothetical protein BJF91_12875 [Allorhizobium taibaishanense]